MNIRNIYISGRITGEAIGGVIAKFRAAERKIRRFGFTPVSPLDNGLPFEAEWADHIGRDIALLLRCDAIYLLPDYGQSRGAQIELHASFSGVEGLLFLATPDILSGLAAWAYFDNNDPSAVSAPFGSGCSATLTAALAENRRGGRRAFIGLFDPSVRKHLPAGVLGFAVPMSRFREMCAAMRSTCLFGTPAWSAIRARIAASGD